MGTRRDFFMKAFGGFLVIGVPPRVALKLLVGSPFVLQAVLKDGEEVFFASPTIEKHPRRIDFSATFEADRKVTVIGSKLWYEGSVFMDKRLTVRGSGVKAGTITVPKGHTMTLIQPVEIHVDPCEGRSDWEQLELDTRAMRAAMERAV